MKINGVVLKPAGRKIEKEKGPEVAQIPNVKDNVRYPTINSYNSDLPGCENLEGGEDYVMTAIVHCTKSELREITEEGKKPEVKNEVSLQIKSCAFEEYKPKNAREMDDSELQTRIKSATTKKKEQY